MGIFARLFTWGKSEANAALDSLENPIRMAEQGIRDLRKDLAQSVQGLAQVKAQAIRTRRELGESRDTAAGYEKKAMLLLRKAENGSMDTADAERLATDALGRRDQAIDRGRQQAGELEKFEAMTARLEQNIQSLRSQISRWENELRTLKARDQVSRATRKVNEQLAQVDPSGTVAMLERMRERVTTEESLAEAYGEMTTLSQSMDNEIDAALGGNESAASLADLRARMAALPAPGEPARLPGPRQTARPRTPATPDSAPA